LPTSEGKAEPCASVFDLPRFGAGLSELLRLDKCGRIWYNFRVELLASDFRLFYKKDEKGKAVYGSRRLAVLKHDNPRYIMVFGSGLFEGDEKYFANFNKEVIDAQNPSPIGEYREIDEKDLFKPYNRPEDLSEEQARIEYDSLGERYKRCDTDEKDIEIFDRVLCQKENETLNDAEVAKLKNRIEKIDCIKTAAYKNIVVKVAKQKQQREESIKNSYEKLFQ